MSAADNDWKKRLGTVYSTNPDFDYNYDEKQEEETLPPARQKLIVKLDSRKRKGKTVSLVTGFRGSSDDLEDLSRLLKTKCGTGGSVKNQEIIIQGDKRESIQKVLLSEGYSVKIKA